MIKAFHHKLVVQNESSIQIHAKGKSTQLSAEIGGTKVTNPDADHTAAFGYRN